MLTFQKETTTKTHFIPFLSGIEIHGLKSFELVSTLLKSMARGRSLTHTVEQPKGRSSVAFAGLSDGPSHMTVLNVSNKDGSER